MNELVQSPSFTRGVRVFSALAGGCDATTGALLIGSPALTLRLMRIAEMPAEPIYLRFVGVFVGAVGLAYLYPFAFGDPTLIDRKLEIVLELTALIRICVALFVVAAILGSSLDPGWWIVSATDALLASVQILILRRGTVGHVG